MSVVVCSHRQELLHAFPLTSSFAFLLRKFSLASNTAQTYDVRNYTGVLLNMYSSEA